MSQFMVKIKEVSFAANGYFSVSHFKHNIRDV